MTLWMVRHAQPLVAPGTCYGRLDVAADVAATFACAQELAQVLPPGITAVTSPLQRCEQLAQALRGLRPDLAYKTDARLQEMDFGNWEGLAWTAVEKTALDDWTSRFADYPVGLSGESVTQFMARVASAFDALAGGEDTLWITHAGVIRAAHLLGRGVHQVLRADQWPMDAPAYGQWCKLSL